MALKGEVWDGNSAPRLSLGLLGVRQSRLTRRAALAWDLHTTADHTAQDQVALRARTAGGATGYDVMRDRGLTCPDSSTPLSWT